MTTTKTMKAASEYMGPGWTLSHNDPSSSDPDMFDTVRRDFFSREDAYQWAREYAAACGWDVGFYPYVLAAIEED